MSPTELNRRRFMVASGAAMTSTVAGCSGDNSIDEIEANIEGSIGHLEDAQPKLESAGDSIHEDEWSACFSHVDDIRGDIDAARQSANDALELAEAEEHDDHVTAIERIQELTTIFEEIADEMELLCEAGQDGNSQEVEQRWETVQQLDEDRLEKEQEVSEALDQL